MRTFNLLFFTDSLKRFVESLDYFVIAYDFIYKVLRYETPFTTLQVMLAGLVFILWFEILLPLGMLSLSLLLMYNNYHKIKFQPPEICYTRNMQFL